MTTDWRRHGVRIISSSKLDLNTPQTPGMTRAAAINRAMAGANKLWAGTVKIHPNAKTAPHHHGELESGRWKQIRGSLRRWNWAHHEDRSPAHKCRRAGLRQRRSAA